MQNLPGLFSAATVVITFEDGATALLPVVVKRRLWGLVRIACCMPAGTFGGWLSPAPLTVDQEKAILRYLGTYADFMLRENPYRPLQTPYECYRCREDHTWTIDLASGYDAVCKRSTAGHRNAVRNAQRSGVTIDVATHSDQWESYSAIYEASIDRWRERGIFTGVRYDRSFFRAIGNMDHSLRRLWLASVKGTVIAGILCFYWKEHVVVWHGAGLSEYFSYRPNNYLYDRAIAHAAEAGYRWFDCNPSGGLQGVDNFKRYLGAHALQSRIIFRQSPITMCIGMLRSRQWSGS